MVTTQCACPRAWTCVGVCTSVKSTYHHIEKIRDLTTKFYAWKKYKKFLSFPEFSFLFKTGKPEVGISLRAKILFYKHAKYKHHFDTYFLTIIRKLTGFLKYLWSILCLENPCLKKRLKRSHFPNSLHHILFKCSFVWIFP